MEPISYYSSDIEWFGYVLINSNDSYTLKVRRYFSNGDLTEARESDFVALVTPVFKANTAEEALKTAYQLTNMG